MAWLSATPKEAKQSRRDTYHEDSPYREMIELSKYETYLVELWHEVGTIGNSGSGMMPLPWSEITAWANRFFGDALEDYELHMIREMSQHYCWEYSEASEPSRPCPKEIILEEVDAEAESKALGDALMSMFGKQST